MSTALSQFFSWFKNIEIDVTKLTGHIKLLVLQNIPNMHIKADEIRNDSKLKEQNLDMIRRDKTFMKKLEHLKLDKVLNTDGMGVDQIDRHKTHFEMMKVRREALP